MLLTLDSFTDNDVIENVISWLFHNASKFQQQIRKEYFLSTCKCKKISEKR